MAMEGSARVLNLKQITQECKKNPSVLHHPSLLFFKDYLQSLGAQFPTNNTQSYVHHMECDNIKDDIVESDIEFIGDVVEEDNDPPQKMGDPTIDVSDVSREAAQLCKERAMHVLSTGNLEDAIEGLTQAIELNPRSASLYATRAAIFLKMNKPNAAIRDGDAALQINPDLAKGYKTQGMARAMLGQWEEAAKDLHLASKLDYDEEIGYVLKTVEPNVRRIEDHKRKYDHLWKKQYTKKAGPGKQHPQSETKESMTQDPELPEALAALKDGIVITINSSKELDTKLKSVSKLGRLLILYFTATWCGPCRMMGPLFTNLAVKYPKVVFLKVDIDQLGSIAQTWSIDSVPTFFFMKQGKVVDKVTGGDKIGLERKIKLYTSKE